MATSATTKLLNKQQLADYLGVSPETIKRWALTNRIPHVRLQRTVRFDLEQVLQAMQKAGESQ